MASLLPPQGDSGRPPASLRPPWAHISPYLVNFLLFCHLPVPPGPLIISQSRVQKNRIHLIFCKLLIKSAEKLTVERRLYDEKHAEERRLYKEKHAEECRLYEYARRENKQHLLAFIQQNFLVQPCFSCHEFTMRFLGFSPNYRSIQYECVHCGKKMRAAAGTPDAVKVDEIWRAYCGFNRVSLQPRPDEWGYSDALNLVFETVPAPMPYEQTTRTPIPEAIRAEVWRRDQGRCVNCGSKENLQFDHIIPVSQGGATSVQNLQLLCQSCNLAKSAKI